MPPPLPLLSSLPPTVMDSGSTGVGPVACEHVINFADNVYMNIPEGRLFTLSAHQTTQDKYSIERNEGKNVWLGERGVQGDDQVSGHI